MRLVLATLGTIAFFGVLVDADWKVDPRCTANTVPPARSRELIDELYDGKQDNDKSLTVFNWQNARAIQPTKRLRGSDPTRHRKLGVFTFQMKMYWEVCTSHLFLETP